MFVCDMLSNNRAKRHCVCEMLHQKSKMIESQCACEMCACRSPPDEGSSMIG